jgi:hypothetical protein
MFTTVMNLLDLTSQQLKRAASIKERIAGLNKELSQVFGIAAKGMVTNNHRTMSASAKRKIAAAQKARWAKLRRAKPVTRSAKPAAKTKSTSAAANAQRSAKLKAYWAAKKRGQK